MKYKLIIFDMDGLMFDTEKMYYKSCKKFALDYGFSYDIDKRNQMAGMSESGIHRFITADIGSEEKTTQFRTKLKEYREEYFKTYDKSLKKEGLDQLLEFIKENNVRACVASSSSREKVSFLLDKENISGYFDFIISGEDLKESKPNPEIFIKAIEKSGVNKNEALILEDSNNGYKAAKASGIDYFIIHDTSFDKNFDADRELDNLYQAIDYIS